jgi:hypothetical protein
LNSLIIKTFHIFAPAAMPIFPKFHSQATSVREPRPEKPVSKFAEFAPACLLLARVQWLGWPAGRERVDETSALRWWMELGWWLSARTSIWLRGAAT